MGSRSVQNNWTGEQWNLGGRHQKRNDTICEQQSNHRGTGIQRNQGNLNIVLFLQNFCSWTVENGKREKVRGVGVRISQLAGNWKVRNSNPPKENVLWTEFNFLQIHKSCNGNNYLQASNVNSWQLSEILSQERWIAACIEVQSNWFNCGLR